MNYKDLVNQPTRCGVRIFGNSINYSGEPFSVSGIYVNSTEQGYVIQRPACFDNASFFLQLFRGDSYVGYEFFPKLYTGYVNYDMLLGNKIESIFMPFLNTFISQDMQLSKLESFAKIAFGGPNHINDTISPYPMNKTTIMHYLDNEFLAKLIYNPAKFVACDSFSATETSEVTEESFGAYDAENQSVVLMNPSERIKHEGVSYQKYTRFIPTISDLLNKAGFAPRLRLLMLYRLLEIVEKKLKGTEQKDLPEFFQKADIKKLKDQVAQKICKLATEDHEGLFGSKIDYGQKLILQTLPIFRVLFGHSEYNTLANDKQDSWWKVIKDKLMLAFGISQFKILKTYLERLQNEYTEDYEEFVNHQVKREKYYRFDQIKEDFLSGLMYCLLISSAFISSAARYGLFMDMVNICLNFLPYAFGMILLYIFMRDYDIGTGKTCKSTLELIYSLSKIAFFEATLVMLTAYSALSLILSTPFYLFKSMLFCEQQAPTSIGEDYSLFSYNSWLDFSLSILEFGFSSFIFAYGINLLPFHALYLTSPFLVSLSIEALRKGPGLIYYKLNNHYKLSSHLISEKLNRTQCSTFFKLDSWVPECMSSYFNYTA